MQSLIKSNLLKILKIFHLLFAGLWIGGTASLCWLVYLFQANSPLALGIQSRLLLLLDFYVVAPSAFGCLLTGVVYGLVTPCGLFRFKWIALKFAVNLLFIAVGLTLVVPWLKSELALSQALAILPAPSQSERELHLLLLAAQWLTALFLLALSVFKPWGRFTWAEDKLKGQE